MTAMLNPDVSARIKSIDDQQTGRGLPVFAWNVHETHVAVCPNGTALDTVAAAVVTPGLLPVDSTISDTSVRNSDDTDNRHDRLFIFTTIM